MKKTFSNYELKTFGKYATYIIEDWVDDDVDSYMRGDGFIDESKTLEEVTEITGYLCMVDYDLTVDQYVTVDMPERCIKFVEEKIKWVESHEREMMYV